MDRNEQKLFISTAVGISFQLGFSSLLLAAAQQRGRDATRWLSEFEERVVQDARRMRVGGDVPEALVAETTETIIAEFRQVFESVRAKLQAREPGRVIDDPARRSLFADQRIHVCGRG